MGRHDFERVLTRHEATMDSLLRIPGVLRVGFGFKEVVGVPTDACAYRVHVRVKRPRDRLPPSELVPRVIGGVPTDVIGGAVCERPFSSLPNLRIGDQIKRHTPCGGSIAGTLGAVVQKDGSRYLLTSQHVLRTRYTPGARSVFSPERLAPFEIQLNQPVAEIRGADAGVEEVVPADGRDWVVDAALALLLPGVSATNRVPGRGPLAPGVRDLIPEVIAPGGPPNVKVMKYGSATGLTRAVIVNWFYRTPEGLTRFALEIGPDRDAPGAGDPPRFEPTREVNVSERGGSSLERVRELFDPLHSSVRVEDRGATGDGRSRRIRLSGEVVAYPGDSGSVVFDRDHRVLGLLYSGSVVRFAVVREEEIMRNQVVLEQFPTGHAQVQYIAPAFRRLGLDPATAIVPAPTPSAGDVRTPDDGPPVSLDSERLGLVGERLRRTRGGLLLGELGRTHIVELVQLVHHRRRVKAVYYRHGGPAFVGSIVRALQEGRPIPRGVGGVTLDEALRRLRDALLIEGSASLQASLRRHGDWLLGLADRCAGAPDPVAALAEALA